MTKQKTIRAVSSRNPEIAQFGRDTQAALDTIGERAVVKFADVYAEPLIIAYDHEPDAVLLVRLQDDANPEAVIATGTTVSFTYTSRGIVIPELDGPSLGTRYRFCFEVIG